MSKKNKKKKKQSSSTDYQILAIILIGLSLLLFLSKINMAGVAGEFLALIMEDFFGWGSWVLILILIGIALMLLNYEKIKSVSIHREFKTRLIGFFILLVTLSAIFHINFVNNNLAISEGKGGGWVGYGLSFVITKTFGVFTGYIIFIAFFIISLIIIMGDIWHWPKIKIKKQAGEIDENKELPKKQPPLPGTSSKVLSLPRTLPKVLGLDIIPRPKIKTKISLPLNLLDDEKTLPTSGNIKANKLIIQRTLQNFGIPVEMGEARVGPTVTQYTFRPAEGIKLSRITALNNDLSLSLAAHPIRIEAPIPGRSLVGLEVPNKSAAIVKLKEVLVSNEFKKRKSNMTLALGKDVANNIQLADLGEMPHLLIAGSTGSGKTICLKSIITSLLYQNSPSDLRFILIDPKRVEFTLFNNLPHLLTPVITKVDKTVNALKWALREMERRFDILSQAKKRDIHDYNLSSNEKMPFIVIVIDELADLMVASPQEVEGAIIRLAQMARATGIHLIVATQRPSVDIITGLIKANITSRIAFSVASAVDSRTILDFSGAEKLLGHGDMLFITARISSPKRIQGSYISDKELKRIVDYLANVSKPSYEKEVVEDYTKTENFGELKKDELLPQARDVVLQAKKASASLLQRRLRVGYARAARLLDLLEEEGTIGPADGAKPREVYQKENF